MSVWGVQSPVSVFPHLKLGRIFFEENLLKNIFFRRKHFILKETFSFKRFHSFEWDNILHRCCNHNWKVLNKKSSHIRQRRLSTWYPISETMCEYCDFNFTSIIVLVKVVTEVPEQQIKHHSQSSLTSRRYPPNKETRLLSSMYSYWSFEFHNRYYTTVIENKHIVLNNLRFFLFTRDQGISLYETRKLKPNMATTQSFFKGSSKQSNY